MSVQPHEVEALKAIVAEAVEKGDTDSLTKKSVTKALSARLNLPPDHYDRDTRTAIAVKAKHILDTYDASAAKKAESLSPVKAAPAPSSPVPSSPPQAANKARKSKPVIEDTDEESAASTPKKTKTLPQKSKAVSPKPAKKIAENKTEAAAKSRKRKSQEAFRTSEFINSEGDPITASQAGANHQASESEAEEEKPKKKSKASGAKEEKKSKAEKGKAPARKRAASVDPDAAELTKLKNFMRACEAQQIWGKVFKKLELDDTRSQCRYLRQQLKDMGMPARMSMEAAKKIGARRALEKEARELGIDLEEIPSSKKGKGNNPGSDDEDDGVSEAEAPEPVARGRPKRAAALKKPPPPQKIRIDSSDDEDEQEGQEGEQDDEDDSESGQSGGGSDDDGGSNGQSSSDEQDEGSEESAQETDDEGAPKRKAKAQAKSKKAPKSKKSKKDESSEEEEASAGEDEEDD